MFGMRTNTHSSFITLNVKYTRMYIVDLKLFSFLVKESTMSGLGINIWKQGSRFSHKK